MRLGGIRISVFLGWLRALCLLPLVAAPALAAAFGFDDVAREAAALARQPYKAVPAADARLELLSYDEYRDIRFRPERALWRDSGSLFTVQFFPLGRGFTRPLRLFEVAGGEVRALQVPASDFSVGRVAASMGRTLLPVDGAAGWRMSFPLNDAGRPDEVIVFLGASYFRALGAQQSMACRRAAWRWTPLAGRARNFRPSPPSGSKGQRRAPVRCGSMRCSKARGWSVPTPSCCVPARTRCSKCNPGCSCAPRWPRSASRR
jgi:hypothetical protein